MKNDFNSGTSRRAPEFFRGCLLGGAVGDALGFPVELSSREEIERIHGPGGVRDLTPSASGKAVITDDTQMTLFTAEGILRAETRAAGTGVFDPASAVHEAYLRWLLTQEHPCEVRTDGWLFRVNGLHKRVAPGRTCFPALASGKRGSIATPLNDSKGCGSVMRVAPAGLFYPKEKAFEMGALFAALTHGHPSAYLSAGAFAFIIASLVEGGGVEEALSGALHVLAAREGSAECADRLNLTAELAKSSRPDAEEVARIGLGWEGHEALGIALFCALRYEEDFERALVAAVNHDGDSDTTGSIAGNILGLRLGEQAIPTRWLDLLELRDVVERMADDLLEGYRDDPEWEKRYPV